MDFYELNVNQTINALSSDKERGLSDSARRKNFQKYGLNVLTKEKGAGIFDRILNAVKEPMLIILLFGFVVALGSNIGKYLKSGEADFLECFGILFAVIVSVMITLIMEGSSKKAFDALNRIYDNIVVRVIRSGKIITLSQSDIVVGDIIIIESGDKIVADGRLIESQNLLVDESALTGESVPSKKDYNVVHKPKTPLAERKNMVFSGTFVTDGRGKMIVTAIGDYTEIGNIAGELSGKESQQTPLQNKLAKLGKTITIIGASCAVLVFIISVVRLAINGMLNFSCVQELFISCIVLIVAAVPEGLPTIVAVSLALNMIKLAKGNALIKKMSATETSGAVSIICSDKTGTLTQNKMSVVSICHNHLCGQVEKVWSEVVKQNFVLNSTADLINVGGKLVGRGSGTECALLNAYAKMDKKTPYQEYRKQFKIISVEPFSSDKKYMITEIEDEKNNKRTLIKGAPEIVLEKCALSRAQIDGIKKQMAIHQKMARRILCFAHADGTDFDKYVYDGFVALADPIRKDVYRAVADCKRAGIGIKILTGDNKETAFAVAKELGVADDISQVVLASDLEKLDDQNLKKIIKRITVIARSTPLIKLRIVRALKSLGEVVAVTGDGINDAPAIKHADVGIAMGISGSDISKEAADVVLLDDSFSTVVKAVAFGRNVYKNLQRFILFQLSVNLSALFFITVCAIMGMPSPFNTLQLLWINVIMDGPPALTLGLESATSKVMQNKPVKRSDGIVGLNMLLRIIFNGLFIGTVMIMQNTFNFLSVNESEKAGALFSLFIIFQLFNAFNSRELGRESILKNVGKNKIMLYTFAGVMLLHFVIVQFLSSAFAVNPLSTLSWIKIIATAFSIIVVSEIYKLAYRAVKNAREKTTINLIKKAS